MSIGYEEIDFRPTPIGDLLLRRRRISQLGNVDIYEVKLGEEFLMSSLFHEAEDQLATLGLETMKGTNLDIMVGGLGLGYTAVSALKNDRVSKLTVVEYLDGVIEWHKKELVPMGEILNKDSRCQIVSADFFALAKSEPKKKYDAILLDIDHSPTQFLNSTNAHFYTKEGLTEMAAHITTCGIFALWADGSADESFSAHLGKVFKNVKAHTIEFDNPLKGGTSRGAVYVAQNK